MGVSEPRRGGGQTSSAKGRRGGKQNKDEAKKGDFSGMEEDRVSVASRVLKGDCRAVNGSHMDPPESFLLIRATVH